jgi:hypothetical protein
MKTRKCIECGTIHHNTINGFGGSEQFNDRCLNCELVYKQMILCVEGINRHIPLMGKPRKLTIIKYKIEK